MTQLLKHPFRTFADEYFVFDKQDHSQPNTPLAATNNIASVKVGHIGMTNLCRKKTKRTESFRSERFEIFFQKCSLKIVAA